MNANKKHQSKTKVHIFIDLHIQVLPLKDTLNRSTDISLNERNIACRRNFQLGSLQLFKHIIWLASVLLK